MKKSIIDFNYKLIKAAWIVASCAAFFFILLFWFMVVYWEAKNNFFNFIDGTINSAVAFESEVYYQREVTAYLYAINQSHLIDISVTIFESQREIVKAGRFGEMSIVSSKRIISRLTGKSYLVDFHYDWEASAVLFFAIFALAVASTIFTVKIISRKSELQIAKIDNELNDLLINLRKTDDHTFGSAQPDIGGKNLNISELGQIHHLTNRWQHALLSYRDELIALNKVKIEVEIAKRVAHDIRGPLSALNLGISSLHLEDSPVRTILEGASKRINSIAADLLKQSKIDYCRDKVTVKEVFDELELLVREIEFRYQLRILRRFLHGGTLDQSAAYVSLEKDKLLRSISNFMTNSIEANSQNIVVAASLVLGSLVISIEDDGDGVPNTILSRLGKQKVSSKIDKNESGFGIGVISSVEWIENAGGKISYQSPTVNGKRGTTVTVEVPMLTDLLS